MSPRIPPKCVYTDMVEVPAAAKDLAEGRGGEVVVSCNWRVFFGFIPDTVADASSLIEARARERCDLEPARPFLSSGRAETTGTTPASEPGD